MGEYFRKPISLEARYTARLAEALTRLASEHATEHQLSDGAVLGALVLVLGRTAGAVARSQQPDFTQFLDFLVRQVRRAVVGEYGRRPYTLH